MQKYRVVERWADERRLALRCQMGRYHMARALSELPPAGLTLNGDKPHLGFGVLLCTASGTAFRVIFESINQVDLGSGPRWLPIVPPGPRHARLHASRDGG